MKNHSSILFCGDINVDLIFGGLVKSVQIDKEVLADRYSISMGSSVVISAATYVSLGGSAAVSGLRGSDDNGRYMAENMNSLGINCSFVQVSSELQTGITLNLIEGTTRSQVTYPGTIREYEGPDLSIDYSDYNHVHFSGIYQQDSFRPNLLKTVKHMKSKGLKVSLDTQWDADENWELLDELYPHLDYLFVNEDEALSISRSNTMDEALEYFKKCSVLTLLKQGEKGALFIRGDEIIKIPSFAVNVVDTTGAGDTFAAAFFYALYNLGKNLKRSCFFASAAAARSCMFVGGIAARSSFYDVEKILTEKYEIRIVK